MEMKEMEVQVAELAIIIIVGILSGFALYMGNTEMASLGMGGLVIEENPYMNEIEVDGKVRFVGEATRRLNKDRTLI